MSRKKARKHEWQARRLHLFATLHDHPPFHAEPRNEDAADRELETGMVKGDGFDGFDQIEGNAPES